MANVRPTGLLIVPLFAVFLAGCSSESPRQAGARTAVEESLSAEYDRGRTRCTENSSTWLIEREATVFICAAERNDGDCDWYRATLKNAGWEVVLDTPRAGCVFPF